MQCANTSGLQPVALRTCSSAAGRSTMPASSMAHGQVALGRPVLVRRSTTQMSRPRRQNHSAALVLPRLAWVKVLPLTL